jgi:hypothetical protein
MEASSARGRDKEDMGEDSFSGVRNEDGGHRERKRENGVYI